MKDLHDGYDACDIAELARERRDQILADFSPEEIAAEEARLLTGQDDDAPWDDAEMAGF